MECWRPSTASFRLKSVNAAMFDCLVSRMERMEKKIDDLAERVESRHRSVIGKVSRLDKIVAVIGVGATAMASHLGLAKWIP